MPDAPQPDASEPQTFEQAFTRLEALVNTLEDDEASLEEALQAYEEGVTLARYCMDRLNTAEMRVQELGLEEAD